VLLDKHCPCVMGQATTLWFDAICRAARRHNKGWRDVTSERVTVTLWMTEIQALRQLYEKKSPAVGEQTSPRARTVWRGCGEVHFMVYLEKPRLVMRMNLQLRTSLFSSRKKWNLCTRASTASTLLYDVDVPSRATLTLEQWAALTSDEITKFIGSAWCKSCQLDPSPTYGLWRTCGLLLLFNKTLASGCYPSEFKKSVMHPLLKNMDSVPARWRTTGPYRTCCLCRSC